MRAVGLVAILVVCGCSRGAGSSPSSPPAPDAAVAVTASAKPASSSPAPAVAAPARVNWSGTYKSAPGTLYIPPDWKNVRWSGSEGTAGTGDGTLSLDVDGTTGRVVGALDGPLGPAVVDGVLTDGKLSASIARRNASDRGFAGTLVGSIDHDHGTGTMNLSSAEASSIRVATFSLERADH
jgi:hypothetical protein